jgi:hypothetical protein
MAMQSPLVRMAHMDIGGRFNLSNKILSNEPSFGLLCGHANAENFFLFTDRLEFFLEHPALKSFSKV